MILKNLFLITVGGKCWKFTQEVGTTYVNPFVYPRTWHSTQSAFGQDLLALSLNMRGKRIVPLVLELPQNKLPLEVQVLGYYLGLRQNCAGKYSPRKLALRTIKAVRAIWDKAYIPCKIDGDIMRSLIMSKNSLIKR